MDNHLIIDPKLEKEKIINFLKKTLKEQKIDKIVLGLSGGIDSTAVFYILKEFLDAKNIYVVQMDYNPRKKFKIDLKEVNVVDVSIKKIVDQLQVEGLVSNFFISAGTSSQSRSPESKKNSTPSPLLDKIRFGNIMARVRMIILFDLAKQLNALVCGTENRSERLLGYFTRFGDSASDIEPISHLYKTQVYQLAKYLEIPKETINQPPSAGLWDGQTDEDEFGFTYLEADQVLHLYYDEKISLEEIIKQGFKNAEKIITRSLNNQFKLKTPYHI